jgi:hypothetical protein
MSTLSQRKGVSVPTDKSEKKRKKSKQKSKSGKNGNHQKTVAQGVTSSEVDYHAEFTSWLDSQRDLVRGWVESVTREWLADIAETVLSEYAGKTSESEVMAALKQHGWSVQSDGCWQWKGRLSQGRPVVVVSSGRPQSASRLMFSETVRPLDSGERITRSCVNLSCVNPEHYRPR